MIDLLQNMSIVMLSIGVVFNSRTIDRVRNMAQR